MSCLYGPLQAALCLDERHHLIQCGHVVRTGVPGDDDCPYGVAKPGRAAPIRNCLSKPGCGLDLRLFGLQIKDNLAAPLLLLFADEGLPEGDGLDLTFEMVTLKIDRLAVRLAHDAQWRLGRANEIVDPKGAIKFSVNGHQAVDFRKPTHEELHEIVTFDLDGT